MEKRLRLTAELKDTATPKIRQLGRDLKEVRQTPGMEAAGKFFKGFSETAGSFFKDGGGLVGVMTGMGLGGLTAAASLATLAKQYSELGDHIFAMRRLGQVTGLTIDQVNEWERVAVRFHIPRDLFDGALEDYRAQMRIFVQRRGELFDSLATVDPGEANKLIGLSKDPAAQFQEAMRWIGSLKTAADQNAWSEKFFGTPVMAQMLIDGYQGLLAVEQDVHNHTHKISPDEQAKSEAYYQALTALNESWDNLKNDIAPTIFKDLTDAVDHFKDTLGEFRATYTWFMENKDKTTKQFVDDNAKAFYEAMKKQHAANDAAEKAGQGPAIDLPGIITGQDHLSQSTIKAHKAFQEQRRNLNPLFHQSAFLTDDQGDDLDSPGPSPGLGAGTTGTDALAAGVKEGVLAAFREWAAESTAAGEAGGGGGSGGQGARRRGSSGSASSVTPGGGEPSAAGGASSPGHIGGQLKIDGESFRFGSGGAGNASIPFGDYPITPGTIGAWGQAHGALGINNNAIWDKALGRMRRGIEMHAGHSAVLITEGCVALAEEEFAKVKAHVLAMIKRDGHAYLHIGPNGASITPLPSLDAEARRAEAGHHHGDEPDEPHVEIHLHDRGGSVAKTGVTSSGGAKTTLHRGPALPPQTTA